MRDTFKRGLSKENHETLREISNLCGKFVIKFRKKEIINLLERLDEVNNIRLIPYLQSLTLSSSTSVSTKANNMLINIMNDLTIDEIRFADSICRKYYYYNSLSLLNRKSDLQRIKKVISELKNPEHFLCLLTMNENGYYREFAMRELQHYDMEIALPYIMLRTNDWVNPVKNLAESVLISYIKKTSNLEIIVRNIELLEAMKSWKRNKLDKVISAIEIKLIGEECYDQLISYFESISNYKIRRILYEYIVINKEDIQVNLIRGLKSKDPLIHRRVIELIDEYYDILDLNEVLHYLGKCNSTFARMANMDLITRKYDSEKATQKIMTFLLDKSISVRDYSRFKLKAFGFTDFIGYYKSEILNAENISIGNILGISETGEKREFDLIKAYLSHSNPKIRKAVLSSASNLDIARSYDLLIDSLLSSSITDSKHAMKLLIKNHLIRIDELMELYSMEGFEEYVYENLLRLISHASKWDSLESLLYVLSSSLGERQIEILAYLENWSANVNRSFITLKDTKREYIYNMLNLNREKLGETLFNQLKFSL